MSRTNPAVMADDPSPRRGEVWLVSFDEVVAGEVRKTRPAVILSHDTGNALLNRVQVVPVSSRVQRPYPSAMDITPNGEPRKAMADQITTASKRRLHRRLGVLGPADLDAIGHVIRMHLAL